MSEAKKVPTKILSIKVDENTYQISYPNTGQQLQIEDLKRSLAKNYDALVVGSTLASQNAVYTIDMIAFLSVCCPKLKADLKVSTFSELEAIVNKKLLTIYIKEIYPWLQAWEIFLNTDDQEEEKKEELKD